MKVDELADGGIDGRPRTQELSSSLKVIPYIEQQLQDWTGLNAELECFLDLAAAGDDAALVKLRERAFKLLELKRDIQQPFGEAVTPASTDDSDDPSSSPSGSPLPEVSEDPEALLELFIDTAHATPKIKTIVALAHKISRYRWTDLEGPLGLYFCILRAALYKRYGPTSAEISVAPTPADYEAFRQNISMRYPSAVPPASDAPPTLRTAFDQPKRTVQPVLGVPGVPASIIEACTLFKQRVRSPPEFLQLWDQHAQGAHAAVPRDSSSLYARMLPFAKSFYTVAVNYILKQGMAHAEPAGMRAALSTLTGLVHSCDHILEQQYILTNLFDLQFHLVAFKYSAHNPILESVLRPGLGSVKSHRRGHSRAASTTDGVQIEQFNGVALDIFVLLMRLLRLTITDRPQRITMIAELPADALKQLMGLYNDDLWTEVLTIFKFQAPLNGKKWRCMNMEIISAIYMHCPFKLDDDWLTGGDTVSDVRAPALPEEVLRTLIDVYNEGV